MNAEQIAQLMTAAQSIAQAFGDLNDLLLNNAEAMQENAEALQDLGEAIQLMGNNNQNPQGGGQNPTFHQTPFNAMGNGVIDYSTKEGKKFHERATAPILPKDEKFDVEPNKFPIFMHRLAVRAKDLGMTTAGTIGMVPADAAQAAADLANIFEDYGSRTYEQVLGYEQTYRALQERQAQDSKILFDMLMSSVSTQGLERVSIWKEQYVITINNNKYEC